MGQTTAYRNGTPVILQAPAKIINGRIMVSLRFVTEALGANVIWDGKTQTIYITSAQLLSKKQRKPLMTFTDDDGSRLFPSKWKSIIEHKGIPVTCCISGAKINTKYYMDWDTVEQMQAIGVEMINHSYSHIAYETLTEDEIWSDLLAAQKIFKAHNVHYDIFAYPGGDSSATARKVVKKFCKCALAGGNTSTIAQISPLKTYSIYRVPMIINDTMLWSLDEYKAKIDKAVKNKGWLIWITHSQSKAFDSDLQAIIESLVDYARSKGVEIVNIEDGLNYFGNILDEGDYPYGEYTVIDCDGNLYANNK